MDNNEPLKPGMVILKPEDPIAEQLQEEIDAQTTFIPSNESLRRLAFESQLDLQELCNDDFTETEKTKLYNKIHYTLCAIANQRQMYSFVHRIKQMNEAFAPITCYNEKLTDLGYSRIDQFHAIICNEVDEIINTYPNPDGLPDFTALADCLGDLAVFVFSEAARWGIPLLDVLHIIMDSQESKLVDGKPIPHPTEAGKFGKGPNYFPPEAQITALLEQYK